MKLHFTILPLLIIGAYGILISNTKPAKVYASGVPASLENQASSHFFTIPGNGHNTETLAYDPAGKAYKVITFNGQNWLAENLQYDIGERDCWCIDDLPENCYKYSRLYNWEGAQEACKALGIGWRLPTDAEWKRLAADYGGYYDLPTSQEIGNSRLAYSALTKGGSTGFSARRGGPRRYDYQTHTGGDYWSGTAHDDKYIWAYAFDRYQGSLQRYQSHKYFGLGCRCVRD